MKKLIAAVAVAGVMAGSLNPAHSAKKRKPTLILEVVPGKLILTPVKRRLAPATIKVKGGKDVRAMVLSGDAAADAVASCESNNGLNLQNPVSSASGHFGFTDGTWGGYGGFKHAKDAPYSVQLQRFKELWNGGKGKGHWRETAACWGPKI